MKILLMMTLVVVHWKMISTLVKVYIELLHDDDIATCALMCVHVYCSVLDLYCTHVHTAVYDTLCMHLLIIGAMQAIGLVVMETAVAPLKIKVDILEVETTEVNISV